MRFARADCRLRPTPASDSPRVFGGRTLRTRRKNPGRRCEMTTDATFAPARRKPLYRDLSLQVLVAMLLGVAVGHFLPPNPHAVQTLGSLIIYLRRTAARPHVLCDVRHGVA